ncbi:membrane protein [Thalassotalea insulae]|uniref:Membrane protein n=1 Tax=Thalassotalea insulae TaxID=2056778 RepID=A0ABQ6GY64_9GAMM|nr:efflux RND transporter periplasmic adaptor subunit [Thalassotalea insulae]GLX80272.1 membrane protein [Thalassotalea insulae]
MLVNIFSRYKKLLLPVIILIAAIVLYLLILSNPPVAKRGRPNSAPQINVDVKTLAIENYAVNIESYGTIKPRTQSVLLPQVSGQIIAISDKFQAGAFFDKGDVLIELDDRDLKVEVKIAQANLFSAKQALSEEQARVEQAKQDWQRLGGNGQAPDLVLRKPQLLAAQAKLYSAQASLDKAQLALERSKIKAPYTGRILSKDVDLGQVISPSTRLAEIYAVDYVEIRLPLKNKDLPYISLPETNRFAQAINDSEPQVTIFSDLVKQQSWQGKVVRTEGAFDQTSQQLFVVAQIDDPYGHQANQGLPLKIGQYVTAKIAGNDVTDAIVIPNKTIYQGTYVYIVENGVLKRLDVTIAWQNKDVAIIESGLSVGQQLVLTPLGQVTSGTSVAINSIDGRKVGGDKQRRGQKSKNPDGQPDKAMAKPVAAGRVKKESHS